MEAPAKLPAIALAVLLTASLVGYFTTRPPAAAPAGSTGSAAGAKPLVDTSLLDNVLQLAVYAPTPEEQAQAREAWRLADHAVDLAFAASVREAEAEAVVPSTGPLRKLTDRADLLKDKVEGDQKRIAALGKDDTDALDRAQAELTLDQDELDDVQQDLDRVGSRGDLRRLLQEHEASDKIADRAMAFRSAPATGTLGEQIRAWLDIREGERRLAAAAQTATERARALLADHNAREAKLSAQAGPATSAAAMRALGAQHKTLTGLDQRMQDANELATVYQRWGGLTEARERSVVRVALRSLAIILAILLIAVLLNGAIGHAFRAADRRRLHQVRMITRIGLQVAAVLLVLMVILGPPTQLSTIIGLVTAGLTVVMKDFIVAFLGWFTLMGKNGISVGDWVEIEGVSGEVIEIGMLKTLLLEVGNWTDIGHPTGRRVAFSNSFAVEGHYFNFSTTGQWLWDEIRVNLPATGDPYETVRRISEIVEEETKADAVAAAEDWQRVAHHEGAREFSAAPAISLRPGQNGLEAVVRYITRAPKRNAAQARIFAAIVQLLHRAV
jgi:small-conductance mechanosensitive channel